MSGQSPNPQSVTQQLSHRLARPVMAVDRERATQHVLDWTGCAIAGAVTEPGRRMRKALGDGEKSHRNILYLGALGNVLEMDDVDKRALLHPGPVVLPAAIVAAVDQDADAEAFLNAVVRGYEAVIRIGRAVGSEHYRYWHNTGTCGPFGAAAATASLYRLNAEETVSALGNAGTQASGFWQVRHEPQSHAKQLHTARAAHAGWLGAVLAKSGVIGVKSILEGEQGFFAATCGDADANAVMAYDKEAPFAIHDVSFKPWPACRHVHAAIDAALDLSARHPDWRDADRFTVRTYRDALIFCDKPAPTDPLSAKFSLQHAVAVAMVRGKPALRDFEEETYANADIADLRRKIAVVEDEALTRAYPSRFGATIEASFAAGRIAVQETPDALGDPENPASEGIIIAKAKTLMEAGGLSNAAAARLCDTVLELSNGGDFKTFANLLFEEALA